MSDIHGFEDGAEDPHSSTSSSISLNDGGPNEGNTFDVLPDDLQPTHKTGRPRHEAQFQTRVARWKQLQRFYSDRYLDLLNADLIEDASQARASESDIDDHSQLGTVTWTVKEKDAFFNALLKKGRHGIKAIVATIGSKSEIEVVHYLKTLQEQASNRHLYADNTRATAFAEIPAAIEIGTVTEALLDEYADALRLYQENVDISRGKQEYPDRFLIDSQTAEASDRLAEEAEDSPDEAEGPNDDALRVFQLSNWLDLSLNVFMNPGEPRLDDNWRNITFDDEEPALTLPALQEYHELMISITRRLIQTAIIMAKSRIRATSWKGNAPRPLLKETDVSAALDILHMPSNSWKYWQMAPRRCHLKMKWAGQSKESASKSVTDYSEVERLLYEQTFNSRRGRSRSRSVDSMSVISTDDDLSGTGTEDATSEQFSEAQIGSKVSNESEEDASVSEHESSTSDIEDDDSKPQRYESDSPGEDSEGPLYRTKFSDARKARQIRIEQEHHVYANRQDKIAGQAEEIRILKALGRRVPEMLGQNEKPLLGTRPRVLRRSKDELRDWMDTAMGMNAWEEYGYESEGEQRRPKRMRLESEVESLTSGSIMSSA